MKNMLLEIVYRLSIYYSILNLILFLVTKENLRSTFAQATTMTMETPIATTIPTPQYNPPFTLITDNANDMTSNSATLSGTIISDDPSYIVHCLGFEYGTSSGLYTNSTCEGDGFMVSGKRSARIDKLLPETTYYYRMYTAEKLGSAYGKEAFFTTLAEMSVVTPMATMTQASECEIKSIGVSPKKLLLKKGQSYEVTVTLEGYHCIPEGKTVMAIIGKKGFKCVSIFSMSEITDKNGEAKFTIIGKGKASNVRVTFMIGNLKKSIIVNVR